MLRVLFAIVLVSTCGCGTITCMDMNASNPRTEVIYGGVRTDVNCIVSIDDKDWGAWNPGLAKCVLKPCSVIDLPLSLAADTLLLPYAIWLTVKKKREPQPEVAESGIEEEPWGK